MVWSKPCTTRNHGRRRNGVYVCIEAARFPGVLIGSEHDLIVYIYSRLTPTLIVFLSFSNSVTLFAIFSTRVVTILSQRLIPSTQFNRSRTDMTDGYIFRIGQVRRCCGQHSSSGLGVL